MLHKTLPAETERITDQGVFRALVSTNSEDREHDVVRPGAFVATIEKWRRSQKKLPLAIDHSTRPEDLVGVVDLAQMEEEARGLVVGGKVNLESPRGPDAWRAMRSDSIGFSIGYLVKKSRPRSRGKGRYLEQVDLFEISLTATPMVFDSRVLEMKAWNGAASNYTDAQYAEACVLDRRDCGEEELTPKERYSLPIAQPGSSWRENPDPAGVHAAAQRLTQVDACDEAIRMAAARLLTAYLNIDEEAPDSVRAVAEGKALDPDEPSLEELKAMSKAVGVDPRPLKIATFKA
jgi:HK97 family phage prohead protease